MKMVPSSIRFCDHGSNRLATNGQAQGNTCFVNSFGAGIERETGVKLASHHADMIVTALRDTGSTTSFLEPLVKHTNEVAAVLHPIVGMMCLQYNVNLRLFNEDKPYVYFQLDNSFDTVQLTCVSYCHWKTVIGTHECQNRASIGIVSLSSKERCCATDARIALQLQRELQLELQIELDMEDMHQKDRQLEDDAVAAMKLQIELDMEDMRRKDRQLEDDAAAAMKLQLQLLLQ
jgi:hypothetical protein